MDSSLYITFEFVILILSRINTLYRNEDIYLPIPLVRTSIEKEVWSKFNITISKPTSTDDEDHKLEPEKIGVLM